MYHADWKSWPWKVRPNYVHLCLTKKWLHMSVSIVFVVYSFLFLPLILNIWAMANSLPTGLTHLRLFFGVRCHQFLNWRREGEMTFMRYVFIYIFLMLLMLSCICLFFFSSFTPIIFCKECAILLGVMVFHYFKYLKRTKLFWCSTHSVFNSFRSSSL